MRCDAIEMLSLLFFRRRRCERVSIEVAINCVKKEEIATVLYTTDEVLGTLWEDRKEGEEDFESKYKKKNVTNSLCAEVDKRRTTSDQAEDDEEGRMK